MNINISVPDGKSGNWEVKTFTVSKEDAELDLLRSKFSSCRGRHTPQGVYKGLFRGGKVIMSNTPDEIKDLIPFFRAAKGNVLINGLGLGVALQGVLDKVDDNGNYVVTSVYVVEKSLDVLNLVSRSYPDCKASRVHFYQDDCFTFNSSLYLRGLKFDAVWHDIWDDISSDNLPQMHLLHRKYGKKAVWQGSWCRERCEWQKVRDSKMF